MRCADYLLFGFFILTVLIIWYYLGKYHNQLKHLSGFYETTNDFNKESGLSIFSLYISEISKFCYIQNKLSYSGYLLMMDSNNNISINEKVEFCLYSHMKHNINDLISINRNMKFTIIFNNLETDLIPRIMLVDFYPITNKLVFYKDDKIYAVFFKNPVLSELEQISKEDTQMDKNKIVNINTTDSINIDKNCESL